MRDKLWLCGMVRGNRQRLEKSISKVLKYFNGLILVVDDRIKPEDYFWLLENCGEGKIIKKKWVNDHAHSSNEVLLSGVMDYPDYFVWIDETDELNENWVKNLREQVAAWHRNDVGMVYLDHPFVIRYHDGLRFSGSPHWGIVNLIGKVEALSTAQNYKKEDYLYNNRDLLHSAFLNPAKYWYCYHNFSNHTQLLYAQFGQQVHDYHESVRIQFRMYCKEVLGIQYTLDSIVDYMKSNIGCYPKFFEDVLELEVNLKDIFRLLVLNQRMEELIKNRFDWSYFAWKDNKPHDNYMGIFNKYNLSIGKLRE